MHQPTSTLPRRLRTDTAWLARASLLGMSLFTGIVVALHLIEPEFDPVVRTVSEYVLGRAGWLLTLAALAFGLGVLALATAVAARLPSPRPVAGLTLLTTTGIAMLVVGAFPTDPIDPTDPNFVTTAGVVHAIAGLMAFFSLAVAAPLLTRRLTSPGQPLAALLRRLAAAPALGLATFWVAGIFDAPLGGLFGRASATGLGERVMAVAFVAWVATAALSILRAEHDRDASPAPAERGQPRS